jgi:hypothetical protein
MSPQLCSLLVLSLLLTPWVAAQPQQPAPGHDSYLFLAQQNNRLRPRAAAPAQPTLCSGEVTSG